LFDRYKGAPSNSLASRATSRPSASFKEAAACSSCCHCNCVYGGCLSFGIAPISVQANSLMGDLISGSYDFPCVGCTYPHFSYSTNPFVVDGTIETSLTIDTSSSWNVNFNADSLVLTSAYAAQPGFRLPPRHSDGLAVSLCWKQSQCDLGLSCPTGR
jgi:hypothetical protein